jgi:2,4'-dihydroxyacetophenone dioxygenase
MSKPCSHNREGFGTMRTFVYEPAGEAHALVVTDDSPEAALVLFIVEDGLIYLDKAIW